MIRDYLHNNVKYDGSFVVAGSWLLTKLNKTFSSVIAHGRNQPEPLLFAPYNDIDVYYAPGEGDDFSKGPVQRLKHEDLNLTCFGIRRSVNLITCQSVTKEVLVDNCDINVCAAAVQVSNLSNSRTASLKCEWLLHDTFIHFLFGDRIIRPITNVSPAQTCIRAAYKSMQFKLPVIFDTLHEKCEGPIYKGHVQKLDEMKAWEQSPLLGYKTKTGVKKGEFLLVPKQKMSTCRKCGGRTSAKCAQMLCGKECLRDYPLEKGKQPMCKYHAQQHENKEKKRNCLQ